MCLEKAGTITVSNATKGSSEIILSDKNFFYPLGRAVLWGGALNVGNKSKVRI